MKARHDLKPLNGLRQWSRLNSKEKNQSAEQSKPSQASNSPSILTPLQLITKSVLQGPGFGVSVCVRGRGGDPQHCDEECG